MAQHEYLTFRLKIPQGTDAPTCVMWTDRTPHGMNELQAKLRFWQADQSRLMGEILDPIFISDGWEPISELGPGAVEIATNYVHKGGFLAFLGQVAVPRWAYVGLTIQFRRLKGRGEHSAEKIKKFLEEESSGMISIATT